MDACHSYLECAPEGQRQLAKFLHVELAVLYFPFRQTTPRNVVRNGLTEFSAVWAYNPFVGI